jgi:tRNA 2-selenouridine synthase
MTSSQESSGREAPQASYSAIESLAGAFHPHAIEVQDFSYYALVIDVRSRAEYDDDHIPGAVQMTPLASAAEPPSANAQDTAASPALVALEDRAVDELPPPLAALVASIRLDQAILIYCGRGGRDSQPLAKALRWRGWTVDVLPGGWINYRRWVQAGLEALPRLVMFRVIACSLGSEAVRVLRALRAAGQQVLDVESLANWRHGALGPPPSGQPSQAWFESQLLQAIRGLDPRAPVWVADLGSQIGSLAMPGALQDAVAIAPMATLTAELPQRVQAWREDEPLLCGDTLAAVDAMAARTPIPSASLLTRWRDAAVAGASDGLLSSLLADYVDVDYSQQLTARSARRHALPALEVASLEPADLVSAVRAWASASGSASAS